MYIYLLFLFGICKKEGKKRQNCNDGPPLLLKPLEHNATIWYWGGVRVHHYAERRCLSDSRFLFFPV